MHGILYIVSTPIGNLKDITLRALEVLKEVDLIFAEDTRVTKKLLSYYCIQKPLRRCDEHTELRILEEVINRLTAGQKIALVSDAGTPCISDPGAKLVKYVREKLSTYNLQLTTVKIIPIPGATALIAALSVAGINADQFTFVGYPPHKKRRQIFFKTLREIKVKPIVLYESSHRLIKTLKNLEEVFGREKEIIVAKELTKIYEEIYAGKVEEAQAYFSGSKGKGEFVLILS